MFKQVGPQERLWLQQHEAATNQMQQQQRNTANTTEVSSLTISGNF